MPESQNSDPITQSTLAHLIDIDSSLSERETQLLAQLESIRQKRQSLQVAIDLISEADRPKVTSTSIEPTVSIPQVPSLEENLPVPQKLPSGVPTSAPKKEKKRVSSSSKKSQTRKTQTSKTSKQVPGWQQYLRSEFRNSSLPQAISSVLKSEAERVWDIATVTEAIFVKEIPQEVKKKVRLQITNLLAQGVRDNKWYRGQQGSYTMSSKFAL